MATELSLKRGFMAPIRRPGLGTPVKGVTITGGAGGGPIGPMRPPVRNDGMVQTSGMYGRGGGSVGQNNMYRRGGPRMGGNLNVTEAINAGHTVMPWAPSSGVGPASRGYRGSGGRAEGFHTGRPSASNSSEYYANRDRAIGNPLEMLKLNGPGRGGNLMQSLIAESRGGGTQSGTDAYYAAKGLGTDGQPIAPTSGDNGYGTKMVDGQQVPMTAEDLANTMNSSSGVTIPGVGSSEIPIPAKPASAVPSGIARPIDMNNVGRMPSQVIRDNLPPSPLMGPESFSAVEQTPNQAFQYNASAKVRADNAKRKEADDLKRYNAANLTGRSRMPDLEDQASLFQEGIVDPIKRGASMTAQAPKDLWNYLFGSRKKVKTSR